MIRLFSLIAMATTMLFTEVPAIDFVGSGELVIGNEAQAQPRRRQGRRVSRRTSRRVVRRHTNYYNHLPGGCVRVSLNGYVHHRCGGIYYRPAVQNGVNVYIIVNP